MQRGLKAFARGGNAMLNLPQHLGGAPPGAETPTSYAARHSDPAPGVEKEQVLMSNQAKSLNNFVAVRSATSPEYAGLASIEKMDLRTIGRALNCGYDKISGNVANMILENAKGMDPRRMSVLLSFVDSTGVEGRYQGRGNPERALVDFICTDLEGRMLKLPLKGLVAAACILLAAKLDKHAELDAIVDEVMQRLEAGTVRDWSALTKLLLALAEADFHCPWLFITAKYDFALNIEDVSPKVLPSLVQAYISSGYDADDLFEAIQSAAATRDPVANARIERQLSKHRHREIPMISRGAQQTWLNIPGFKQEKQPAPRRGAPAPRGASSA